MSSHPVPASNPIGKTALIAFAKRHPWKLAIVALPAVSFIIMTLLAALFRLPLGEPVHQPVRGVTHLHGVWHIPLVDEDGDDMSQDALTAAQGMGMDFVVLTGLNKEPVASLSPGQSGPIVIPAVEYAAGPGSIILFGQDAQVQPGLVAEDPSRRIMERLAKSPPSIGIAAHPFSWEEGWDIRALAPSLRGQTRNGAAVDALPRVGVEILSAGHEDQNEFVFPYLAASWSTWLWVFNEPHAMLSVYDRPDEALNLWDEISSSAPEPAPGLCAVNISDSGIAPERAMRTLGTYVLLENPVPADRVARARAIEAALAEGRSYCALDLLALAPGFVFTAIEQTTGTRHPMGSRVEMSKSLTLSIQSPSVPEIGVRVSVFRDGLLTSLKAGDTAELPVEEPGVYRVEVDLEVEKPSGSSQWMTWIYSNPITVAAPKSDSKRR